MPPEPETNLKHHVIDPLLIACDRAGAVLWMSKGLRQRVGDVRNVTELLRGAPATGHVPPLQFWTLFAGRRTLVLCARSSHAVDRDALDFFRLERRIASKLFRLLRQERLLAERVRCRGGNRTVPPAIRLIELERQRLGRDLHTGIGQSLAAIRLQLDVIATDLPSPEPRIRRALNNIGALAGNALEQVRSVSHRLHPPEWQRLPLTVALRQLWELSAIADQFRGQLRLDPISAEPEPEVKAVLYRVMQEALSNILRHSRATRVDANLEIEGDEVVLTVTDNGIGFDVSKLRAAPASVNDGIGIRSIREQVEGIGGKFDIQSGPTGTKLVVAIVPASGE